MTHNPIYDGPVYDSITTQFETLAAETSKAEAFVEDLSPPRSLTSQHQQTSSDTHKISPPTERYVEYQTNQLPNKSFPSNSSTHSSPLGIDVANTSHSAHICIQATETEMVMDNTMEGDARKLKLTLPTNPNHFLSDHTTSRDRIENGQNNEIRMLELSSSASANLIPAEFRGEDEKYSIMSPVAANSGSSTRGGDCGSGVWLYSEV